MPKTALAAAALSCLALSFATATPVAVAHDLGDESSLGYCPRPGAEIVADGHTAHLDTAGDHQAQAKDTLRFETVPVLESPAAQAVRVATLDANLTRDTAGALFEELSAPGSQDAVDVARIIQTVRPHVLVLTGIDADAGKNLAEALNTNYLAVGGDTYTGISYPHMYSGTSNAGVDSGADLNRNGTIGDPGDALGYGNFPGQSSIMIFSKYPIDTANIRDFTALPWNEMPDNNIPAELSELERDVLPLASVSHWDIPIKVNDHAVHILASSAADASRTDHDVARNHDQIRFWTDYLTPDTDYIRDDRGTAGPLAEGESFVIAGSLKADPNGDGPADSDAISELLSLDNVVDPEPGRTVRSNGLLPVNPVTRTHTAPTPTNDGETYRADYVLSSSDLTVTGSGVFDATANHGGVAGILGLSTGEDTNQIVWADVVVGD